MHLAVILTNLRIQDVIDILFLSILVYHLHLWFKGTKAFKALIGLALLGVVFTVAETLGLFLTRWVFQILWQVFVILLVILFQKEIRQALERFNPLHTFGLRRAPIPGDWIPGFSSAVFDLARRRVGAIFVIERTDDVREFIMEGHRVAGEATRELLMSLFQKESPLHDGAALIKNGCVTDAACYLPLSAAEGLPKKWGTRHRAAMGISERCDALVAVVSEERGEVCLACCGTIVPAKNAEALEHLVMDGFTSFPTEKSSWKGRVRSLLFNQWKGKIAAMGVVCMVWLLLAGQQDFEATLMVPMEMENIPYGVVVAAPVERSVKITVRGIRKDASLLNAKNVHARINFSRAAPGRRIFIINRNNIILPHEGVYVTNIEPHRMEFEFKKKTDVLKKD